MCLYLQPISEDPELIAAARQKCQTYFDRIAVVSACLSHNVTTLTSSMDNCIDDIVVRHSRSIIYVYIGEDGMYVRAERVLHTHMFV